MQNRLVPLPHALTWELFVTVTVAKGTGRLEEQLESVNAHLHVQQLRTESSMAFARYSDLALLSPASEILPSLVM